MTLREVTLLTAFLAFLVPGPAVGGGPMETWYDEESETRSSWGASTAG